MKTKGRGGGKDREETGKAEKGDRVRKRGKGRGRGGRGTTRDGEKIIDLRKAHH